MNIVLWIIALVFFILILVQVVILRNKDKKYNLLFAESEAALNELNDEWVAEYNELKEEFATNFKNTFTSGELKLIEKFQLMLQKDAYKDFIIYGQFQFLHSQNVMKPDFLVVCPSGMFIIESKIWNGTTYIYQHEDVELPNGKEFDLLGLDNVITVFNAKYRETINKAGQQDSNVKISTYTNPFSQVRGYSRSLQELLNDAGIKQVKNLVVFETSINDSIAEIFYDKKALQGLQHMDGFTSLTTSEHIEEYFSLQKNKYIDIQGIVDCLENMPGVSWVIKLNSSNNMQAPFHFKETESTANT
jgi:hypothetical protein